MKKLIFAAILTLIIYGCAEDKNNTINYDIVQINEAPINETTDLSVTVKNPLNTKTDLLIKIIVTDNQSIKIKDTTCGTIEKNILQGTLDFGQECVINYTFSPTAFSTEMIILDARYERNFKEMCKDITLWSIKESFQYGKTRVINKVVDANENKSPDTLPVTFKDDYSFAYETKKYKTTQNINLAKGKYYFDIPDFYMIPLDNNCRVTGNTLEVLGSNECSLEFSYTTNLAEDVFYKIASDNGTYLLDIAFKIPYTYMQETSFFWQHFPEIPSKDIFVMKITQDIEYDIQGTFSDYFMVVPAPFDGCIVTPKRILLPQGRSSCFVTIDVTNKGKEKSDYFEAVLYSPTLNKTYDIGLNIENDAIAYYTHMCNTAPK